MKNILFILLIAVALVIYACGQQSNAKAGDPQPVEDEITRGKKLFLEKCAACHAVDTELVGPPMAGVRERWQDQGKLYEFIRNSQKVIKEDKYAHDLWMEYNQMPMNPFPELTNKDIDAILKYTESALR